MIKNALTVNNTWTMGRKAVACLLVAMTAGVVTLEATSFVSAFREIALCENAISLDQKLTDLQETCYLLRHIGASESTEVRQLLAMQLSTKLREAREALPAADAQMRAFGERVCDAVFRNQKMHSDVHLAFSKSTGSVDFEAPTSGVASVPDGAAAKIIESK